MHCDKHFQPVESAQMSQISLLIRINASPEEVYEKLVTSDGIAAWFTEATYSTDKVTEELKLQLWNETNFIVRDHSSPTKVIWHCVSADNPWFGTDIVFKLRAESNKTIVSFDHTGWQEITDLYRDCAMSWAYFLESLRLLIEEGAGTPESIAPSCEAPAS